jgi:hypothetical protein
MDMIFVQILLCISLLRCISLSAGVNIVTATFRVCGKHHGKDRVRKCAMKVLQNVSLLWTYLKQVILNISVRSLNVLVHISCDLGIINWIYLNFLNILIVFLLTFLRLYLFEYAQYVGIDFCFMNTSTLIALIFLCPWNV